MNPLGFGSDTETLQRARRSQVSEDGLPVFSRDACPDVLFKILSVVNVLPSIAQTRVQGVVVRELSEENFSLIHDVPLPNVIRRRRVPAMTFVDNTAAKGLAHTARYYKVLSTGNLRFAKVCCDSGFRRMAGLQASSASQPQVVEPRHSQCLYGRAGGQKCDSLVGSETLQQKSCCISVLQPTCYGSFRTVAWTSFRPPISVNI